jgi:hypothetical protein
MVATATQAILPADAEVLPASLAIVDQGRRQHLYGAIGNLVVSAQAHREQGEHAIGLI